MHAHVASPSRAQALLELDTPELSVFSSSWTYYLNHKTSRNPSDVNRIARYWYSKRSEDDQTLVGPAQGSAYVFHPPVLS